MNLNQLALSVGALLFAATMSSGQTYSSSFTCNTGTIVNEALHGSGTSFADFNQDGWPDLTMGYYDGISFYQNNEGTCELVELDLALESDIKLPTWVDFDNDGDRDLFVTQRQGPDRLFENDGDFSFTDITSIAGFSSFPAPSFGSSWADYDRDGDLDVYICHFVSVVAQDDPFYFDYFNDFYRNNGDGTFTEVTDEAGVADGISLSFQSAWLDYNKDGWPDLYVINDLEDPNRLYHNNGDGTFEEIGETSGSAVTMLDAMTATVGDFNNDGWEDIFCTGVAIQDAVLLLNLKDGTFDDIAVEAGVDMDKLCWGANWLDADLDGDLDLYVCENFYLAPGLPNVLMRNNGDSTFTDISTQLQVDFQDSYSVSSADWNLDGTPDLLVSNLAPQENDLWVGSPPNANWLAVDPVGSTSNLEGVGAVIEVWAGNLYQYRMHRMGENYLSQDGDAELFGLADAEIVDSISVSWPSGLVDHWADQPVNQQWQAIEGATQVAHITTTDLLGCQGDFLQLTCDCPGPSVWSDGSVGDQNYVQDEGWYTVTSTNVVGLESSDSVYVTFVSVTFPELEVNHPLCYPDSGSVDMINPEEVAQIFWESLDPMSLPEGLYQLAFTDAQGCSDSVGFEIISPDELIISGSAVDALCFGDFGQLSFQVAGGTPPYDFFYPEGYPDLPAGNYPGFTTDLNGCGAQDTLVIYQPDSLEVLVGFECLDEGLFAEALAYGGIEPYTFVWSEGSDGALLEGGDLGQSYSVEITDNNGCLALSEEIFCALGMDEWFNPGVRLVPNPTCSTVHIQGITGPVPFALYNAQGRKVMSGITNDESEIDLGMLSPGSYLISFEFASLHLIKH